MTAHDPMCRRIKTAGGPICDCDLIREVRAEVVEEIGQAIDTEYQSVKRDFGPHPTNMEQWYLDGLDRAEQIARTFKEANDE